MLSLVFFFLQNYTYSGMIKHTHRCTNIQHRQYKANSKSHSLSESALSDRTFIHCVYLFVFRNVSTFSQLIQVKKRDSTMGATLIGRMTTRTITTTMATTPTITVAQINKNVEIFHTGMQIVH